MQIEAPQRLSTAIIQLPTGDSVVEAMVDLQVEPPAVISWDQVRVKALLFTPEISWIFTLPVSSVAHAGLSCQCQMCWQRCFV